MRDELIEVLLERAPETTILISSHDLGEIESFSSHAGFLEQGPAAFFGRDVTADRSIARSDCHARQPVALACESSAGVASTASSGLYRQLRPQQLPRLGGGTKSARVNAQKRRFDKALLLYPNRRFFSWSEVDFC